MSPNEMLKGVDPALMVCGCPDSKTKYPQYPNCTCNPENWNPALVACDPGTGIAVVGAKGLVGFVDDHTTWPTQESIVFQEA
jgi:hypothetical protein